MKGKQMRKRTAEIVEQMQMTCQQHVRTGGSDMFNRASRPWNIEDTTKLYEWAWGNKN